MPSTAFCRSLIDEVVPIRHAPHQSATYIRQVLPDSSPNLVWLWQEGLATDNTSQWIPLPCLSLSGPLTYKKEYLASFQAKGLIFKLKPWTVGLLKDWEAIEITNQLISFTQSDIPVYPAPAMHKPVVTPFYASWLETIFARYFSDKAIDNTVVEAIRAVERSQNGLRIKALAEQAAQCTRQFERRFKTATGLTPKQFIRNVRFERARNWLALGYSLLDVTYACGYFDQTHFTREFKRVGGITPKTFQQDRMSLFY